MPHRVFRLAILAYTLVALVAIGPVAAAPFDARPKILLHLQATTQKNTCAAGQLSDCGTAVTAGRTASDAGGPFYFAYVLAARGNVAHLGGVQFGVTYQNGAVGDRNDGVGVEIFNWTNCATLEFSTTAPRPWPEPGSSNLLTWNVTNACQTGETAVVGYFYVGAYTTNDRLELIPRPVDNLAAVANCNAVVFNLLPSDLGSVEFSGGGMTAGCNPCVETCDFVVVPDTSPPSAIVLSLADRSTNYLRVRWPAPDEDGPNGYGRRCQGYDLRRSTLPLTEANFAAAFPITNVPTPNGPGVVQEANIYSLQHGTTYYVAIRAVDDAQNWGALSNVLVATTLPAPDTTPPAAVTTLTITDVTASSFLMAWNAPGDDGTVGQAAEYDLRYSPVPITAANFGAADAATGEPLPGPSGTLETFALTGLSEGTRFYVALRTRDEVPLWSGLSNVATAVTLATGPPDTIPPAAVTDLAVTAADINYAALEWTVPGDDSLSGRAVVYDMRRSALPITAANFVAATAVVGEPVPGLPGARQGMTVSGLTSGVRYYFALKTGDEVPNWSPLSNVVNQLTHQSNSNARLMLHVAAPTTKSPCVSGQLANCRDAVTRGDLAPIGGTGPWYFVYLLATRFTELGGLQCGIDYDQGRSDGDANLEGIDVFGWTLCATLEFPTPGTRSWPKPGSGNSLTWDAANRCQTGATAVGGFFYLAAYSADILKIIPRPIDGVARVANCGATQNLVLDEYLGTARFSFGGAIAGYNPCDASQSVGVERTTWSRIKTLVGR